MGSSPKAATSGEAGRGEAGRRDHRARLGQGRARRQHHHRRRPRPAIDRQVLEVVSKDIPIIIVIQSDYAKVIGQTLQAINPTVPILCIDQIKVETGDYIDIGEVLPSGVVPIVVKTLAFHSK
ncbi:hypothetical protein LSPH24S_07700 [Lysinibacillus sphaericus]